MKVESESKVTQLCLTLRPHRWQPTRLPRPWDSLGKNTGVGCHFLLQCMKVKSESVSWVFSSWGASVGLLTRYPFSLSCIGERNGNPLQCSCLKNPRDGGAWWAAIYGVAQSWTRLSNYHFHFHSNWCEVILHCSFDLHSSNNE